MKKQKIYIIIRETMVDGAVMLDAYPCDSTDALRAQLKQLKDEINREGHFKGFQNSPNDYEIEDNINTDMPSFYINDPCDTYYEMLHVKEKKIFSVAQ